MFIDVDHTLSSAAWRDSMIGGGWDEYHRASICDEPIPETVELVNTLYESGWLCVGVTTRPEKWRILTNRWMIKHGVKLNDIIMRPNDDFRPSPEIKCEQVKKFIAEFETEAIFIAFDDRDDVVAAYKAEGVMVIQVHSNGRQRDGQNAGDPSISTGAFKKAR